MKIKTSELIDAALDWAVAKCEGKVLNEEYRAYQGLIRGMWGSIRYKPSTHWAQGGPIIDREIRKAGLDIWSRCSPVPDGLCAATYTRGVPDCYIYGPTPLIAAMRCYVASKLGDTVDIPEELT